MFDKKKDCINFNILLKNRENFVFYINDINNLYNNIGICILEIIIWYLGYYVSLK